MMDDPHIAKQWSLLALYILQASSKDDIEENWKDILTFLASYYYDLKQVKKKDRSEWQLRPSVDKMLSDPEFSEYVKTHKKYESCEHYQCTIVTLNRAIKALEEGITEKPRNGKMRFKEMYDSNEELRNDIQNYTLRYCAQKYNIPRMKLQSYVQSLKIQRGGVKGKRGKKNERLQ